MVKSQQNFIECEKNWVSNFFNTKGKSNSITSQFYPSNSVKYFAIKTDENLKLEATHDIAVNLNRANAI